MKNETNEQEPQRRGTSELTRLLCAPFDGFDLDLLELIPSNFDGLEHYNELYTFARPKSKGVFSSISFWNDCGCVFLTDTTDIIEKEDGWKSWKGHLTDNQIVTVSIFEALRYLWVQDYNAVIDGKEWVEFTNERTIANQDILYHIRGWKEIEDYEEKLMWLERWVKNKVNQAEEIIGCV